jgi:hypothetical protein
MTADSDSDQQGTGPDPDVDAAADIGADVDAAADVEIDREDVPDWDDEYVDRVSDRLLFNYDLENDRREGGFSFTLYGRMQVHNQKHFLHPAINFADHDATEHLFVTRIDAIERGDLERLVSLGHDLADEWIDADEEHFSTDFTFGVIADSIPEAVEAFVSGFEDRNLLKYGFYGHYEVNLFVVAPSDEAVVASEGADVAEAFALWEPIEREEPGLWDLFKRRFQL